MGHLDRETRTDGTAHTTEEPTGGGHQSDARRRIGTQLPHHGRVNVLEKHTGHLSHNGGQSQSYGE